MRSHDVAVPIPHHGGPAGRCSAKCDHAPDRGHHYLEQKRPTDREVARHQPSRRPLAGLAGEHGRQTFGPPPKCCGCFGS
eukprot:4509239-Alexandrium_andersonii.AAC.1